LYDILDIISYVPNHGLSCHDYYCYQKKYRKFQEKAKEDSAGSGNFVPFPPSQERGEKKGISNPRVLSDMGLAIPRPTRLGDPRSVCACLSNIILTSLYSCPLRTALHPPSAACEEAIKKMIESSERMIDEHNNPNANKDLELQIRTLQMRLEIPDKLKALLKEKVRQKEEAMHIEDTQRLFAEIQMIKVVLCLGHMNRVRNE
jgi:hypothetical protein